ncbi:MAG: hypothetical protein KAS11_04420 [Candidatus Aenigmarchaeota archaeon]|nr:hypothetical protein [Candidatus Aenigmarchaeota archaeon]
MVSTFHPLNNLEDLLQSLYMDAMNKSIVIVSDEPEKSRDCLETIRDHFECYFTKNNIKGTVDIVDCSSEEDINLFGAELDRLKEEHGLDKIYLRWPDIVHDLKDEKNFLYIPMFHNIHYIMNWTDLIYDTYSLNIPYIMSMDKNTCKNNNVAGGAASKMRSYIGLVL